MRSSLYTPGAAFVLCRSQPLSGRQQPSWHDLVLFPITRITTKKNGSVKLHASDAGITVRASDVFTVACCAHADGLINDVIVFTVGARMFALTETFARRHMVPLESLLSGAV